MTQAAKPRRVSKSIQIWTTPEKAFAAFVDLEKLKQWWGASTGLIEPKKGGVYALAWGQGEQGFAYVGSGVIKSLAPGKRLRTVFVWACGKKGSEPVRIGTATTRRSCRGGKSRSRTSRFFWKINPLWF